MRLPNAWNGRFFYQANGGIDGSVGTATGSVNGGAGLTNALNMGFAVISSDAGHLGSQGPTFGLDPQARLDYGYQAVAALTPMAKSAIASAYGKGPDRSYFGGCSNGGRHTMVAATRYADQYDGFLVGNPGFRLPLAAIANMAAYRAYATRGHRPREPLDRLHRRRAFARLDRRARQVRRARRQQRRSGAGHDRLPGRLQPRTRRAHLHRRTRRHLPVGRTEERDRPTLRRHQDARGHDDLHQLPVRQRARHRQHGLLEFHGAADARLRRHRR